MAFNAVLTYTSPVLSPLEDKCVSTLHKRQPYGMHYHGDTTMSQALQPITISVYMANGLDCFNHASCSTHEGQLETMQTFHKASLP